MRFQRALPLLLALLLGLNGCASVSIPRETSQALPASDSAFGRSVARQAAPHDGRSGFR
ncbi:MAG TPA: phospholipase, partial [Pseudomonas sp.]|nr:phospholipase [Pseudomonas sp.]